MAQRYVPGGLFTTVPPLHDMTRCCKRNGCTVTVMRGPNGCHWPGDTFRDGFQELDLFELALTIEPAVVLGEAVWAGARRWLASLHDSSLSAAFGGLDPEWFA